MSITIPMTREYSSSLPRLIFKTAQASWRHYHRKPRPLSLHRLNTLIIPNLSAPIFIIGSPRSGTTFLGHCLAQLPEISYHFEPIATKFAAKWVYENRWSFEKAAFFYRSVYGWLMRLHFDADLLFAEKTPRNCFLIPFLGKAFPTARFIYITRDGRDVALSYSKQPWLQQASISSGKREPGGYAYGTDPRFWVEPNRLGEFESTTDIHRCIWAWRRHVEAAELGLAHIAPSRQYRLRYEQLVQYPHEEADRLLDFLSIDDPASQSIFQRAVAQARPDSLGNWKRDLSEESLGMIMHEAGALLSQLQYT